MLSKPDDQSSFICRPDYLATILVSGTDAGTFLQGQLTSDVEAISDNYQLGAWCNPKGRVIALLKLWQTDEGIWMQFPRSLVEEVVPRMRMYILRSDVTIQDRSDAYDTIGIIGTEAVNWLTRELGELPGQGKSLEKQGIVVNADAVSVLRYQVNGKVPAINDLLGSLPDSVPVYAADAWISMDIHSGIPEIWPGTREQFIPQSLNLDILGAVNFGKGCYVGQEIVARTHYLGKPKQRMFLAKTEQTEPGTESPAPGARLFLPGASGQSCGSVVSVYDTGKNHELLVSLKIQASESGACLINDSAGPEITITDTPYPIDEALTEA